MTTDPRIERASALLAMYAEVLPGLLASVSAKADYNRGIRADLGVGDEEWFSLDWDGMHEVHLRHDREVIPLVRKHARLTAKEWRRLRVLERQPYLVAWRADRDGRSQ